MFRKALVVLLLVGLVTPSFAQVGVERDRSLVTVADRLSDSSRDLLRDARDRIGRGETIASRDQLLIEDLRRFNRRCKDMASATRRLDQSQSQALGAPVLNVGNMRLQVGQDSGQAADSNRQLEACRREFQDLREAGRGLERRLGESPQLASLANEWNSNIRPCIQELRDKLDRSDTGTRIPFGRRNR
jgi:hypothetical protein